MNPRRGRQDAEFAADRIVHVVGLILGIIGAVVAIAEGMRSGGGMPFFGVVLYSAGLVAMLGCSAVYNLAPGSRRRDLFRRLDHAAIFIMIAATYSPFTIGRLDGAWSFWLAGFVWAFAILGAVAKIAFPRRAERLAIPAYLALGWCVVIAFEPMLAAFGFMTILLIAIGGLVYSIGVGFYVSRDLRYHKSIWHGFVLSAAACHYAAVFINI